MADIDRILRLRELARQLAQQPESPERDALLRRARARIVDLETSQLSSGWTARPAPAAPSEPLLLLGP